MSSKLSERSDNKALGRTSVTIASKSYIQLFLVTLGVKIKMDLHPLADWEALIWSGTENQNYATNLRNITFHSRVQEEMIELTGDRCYKFKHGAGIKFSSTSSTSPSNHPSVTSTATASSCGSFRVIFRSNICLSVWGSSWDLESTKRQSSLQRAPFQRKKTFSVAQREGAKFTNVWITLWRQSDSVGKRMTERQTDSLEHFGSRL